MTISVTHATTASDPQSPLLDETDWNENHVVSGTKADFDAACSDGNFLYVGDVTQYTDEMAQDAVGTMVNSSLTYVDATPSLSLTSRTINGTAFDATADITISAAAGTLTGGTLAAGVLASSLTSVGTLTSLGVSGVITDTQSINATSTDGLLLQNTTAAAAGAQQWSPRLHLKGQGWKTTATAASQSVDWIMEVRPVQGAANPTSLIVIASSINGGTYTDRFNIDSAGTLTTGGANMNGTSGFPYAFSGTANTGMNWSSGSPLTLDLYAGGTVVAMLSSTGGPRINLGGKTSSFPALKRNGTSLNVRLADDSADADLTSKAFAASGQITTGINSGTLGAVIFNGSTSGAVTINPAAAAGTWTFTLPITGGLTKQFMQTNGSGTTIWATAPGQSLFDSFADAGNATTSETDLVTNTVAASQLGANGDKLEATYGGIFVTSGGTATRQVKIYFGGTAIFDSTAILITGAASWIAKVNIIRVSGTVIRYAITLETQNAPLAAYTSVGELTGLTLSSTNILKITGQAAGVGAATNDIVSKLSTVCFNAAA